MKLREKRIITGSTSETAKRLHGASSDALHEVPAMSNHSGLRYFIYGGLIIHCLSFLLFIFDPIKVSYYVFFLISVASILINLAIFLATFTFKKAQKHYSSIFCLVYLQIVWSSLIGFFIFNEILNNIAFIGALFIVLSGIISIPGQFKQLKAIISS